MSKPLLVVADLILALCVAVPQASSATFLQLTNTLSPVTNCPPTISKDGSKVAFVSKANIAGLNASGGFVLYTMRSDGASPARVGSALLFDVSCSLPSSLTSDGSKVVFLARPNTLTGASVYIASADGTGSPMALATDVNSGGAVISSDGSTVAYSSFPGISGGNQKIYAINSNGTNNRLLVEACCGSTGGLSSLPTISGDGSKVAFAFLRDLITPAVAGSSSYWWVAVITTDGSGSIAVMTPNMSVAATSTVTISDNNSKVAFAFPPNPTDVYMANADGSNLHVFLTAPSVAWPVQFTADATKLMYDSAGNIFLANSDGSGSPQQITSSFADVNPSISGDGNKIVFQSQSNVTGQNADGNVEILLAVLPATEFLSFPLRNKTPFTAKINSVFDHHMTFPYCPDGIVSAYTNEEGQSPYASRERWSYKICRHKQLHGYGANQSLPPFSLGGQYTGGGDTRYLFYDGRPGYDYRTKDQRLDGTLCSGGALCNDRGETRGETEVLAAADGTVVCTTIQGSPNKQACMDGPGEVKIDHGNGYLTIYLHLSQIYAVPQQTVSGGKTVIGISGDKGAEPNPHLHFEVHLMVGGRPVPVDPYGWSLRPFISDPYDSLNGFNNINVRLWKP